MNAFKMAAGVIQNRVDTKALSEFLKTDENDAVNQIVTLVNSAISNGCTAALKEACIYPNLNGNLVKLNENYFTTIYFDAVQHNRLYDIAEAFANIDSSNKIKPITVDRRFNITALGLPPMTDEIISQKINHALSVLFSKGICQTRPIFSRRLAQRFSRLSKRTSSLQNSISRSILRGKPNAAPHTALCR